MQRSLKSISYCLGGIGLAAVLAPPAYGSGLALMEHSVSDMGNAYAGGAAIAEDATTVYFNPAGMTRLEGRQLAAAAHVVVASSDFADSGSSSATGGSLSGDVSGSYQTAVIPNLFYVTDTNMEGLKAGIGISVPYGLTTEYNDNWVGRYHAIRSDMKTVNINPSVAYKISDKFSVGGGLNFEYMEVELTSAVDFGGICLAQELGGLLPAGTCGSMGLVPQQNDGYAKITGSSWGYGWNLGVLYTPSENTRFGFAYRSAVEHDADGNADFTVPGEAAFMTSTGLFVDTDVKADVSMPATASLSGYHRYNDKIALMADVSWTNWAVFDELRIKYQNSPQPDTVTTENWHDTWRGSVGMNYFLNDRITLRGGIAYDQSPIPDAQHRTPRIPGNDRRWINVGAGYRLNKDSAIDIAYAHIYTTKTGIDNTVETSVPTLQHTLTGDFDSAVDVFSVQFRKNF